MSGRSRPHPGAAVPQLVLGLAAEQGWAETGAALRAAGFRPHGLSGACMRFAGQHATQLCQAWGLVLLVPSARATSDRARRRRAHVCVLYAAECVWLYAEKYERVAVF